MKWSPAARNRQEKIEPRFPFWYISNGNGRVMLQTRFAQKNTFSVASMHRLKGSGPGCGLEKKGSAIEAKHATARMHSKPQFLPALRLQQELHLLSWNERLPEEMPALRSQEQSYPISEDGRLAEETRRVLARYIWHMKGTGLCTTGRHKWMFLKRAPRLQCEGSCFKHSLYCRETTPIVQLQERFQLFNVEPQGDLVLQAKKMTRASLCAIRDQPASDNGVNPLWIHT